MCYVLEVKVGCACGWGKLEREKRERERERLGKRISLMKCTLYIEGQSKSNLFTSHLPHHSKKF